jgi:hypothetical protein
VLTVLAANGIQRRLRDHIAASAWLNSVKRVNNARSAKRPRTFLDACGVPAGANGTGKVMFETLQPAQRSL